MSSKFYAVTCEHDTFWYFRTYEEAKAFAVSMFKEDGVEDLEGIANDFDEGREVGGVWIEDCYFNSYKEV